MAFRMSHHVGVSAHGLYKWVKAVPPDRSEQQSQELVEAKSEVLRLRSQPRCVEEERDLLKKPRWSMKPSLSRELAMDALLMAVWRRKPADRVIVHSDQGSQYGSDDFKRFYQANNLEPSMSRRANCWDNAVAQSFFPSLKKERIRKRIYKTRDLARADIFDYIEIFYNRPRRHSHIGEVSPEAFKTAAA